MRRVALAVLVLVGLALALDRALPPDLARHEDRSLGVLDREGRLLRAFTTSDDAWRFRVGPEDVDPLYLAMLLAYEDKRFASHPGVDLLAVGRALLQWGRAGRPVSGASTITMQAARLLEPRPRTLRSKLIEMVRALQLERRLEKNQVLGIYLTLAPMGGNLEGVRAASLAYLGKEPRHLSPAEAALLVALPQSPSRLRPDRAPEAARAARDKVLARAVEAGVLDQIAAGEAMEAPVPVARRPLPFLAPHLADRLRGAEDVATTLDARLQERLEALVARETRRLGPRTSAAVLVIERGGGEVRAHVGSAGYFEDHRHGMVDMTRAVRSPGSALKPLIYGIAFGRDLAHPETVIRDLPRRWGDWAPVNFDSRFQGEITLREALQRSQNLPAVALLERIGPVAFDRVLRGAGVRLRLDPAVVRPTLPIALGGVGVTLEQLAVLYGAIADGGRVRPLRVQPGPADEALPLMPEAAAWHVADVLAGALPPRGFAEPTTAGRAVAYKTGTSYGFRDAWSIGFDGDHLIAVWVGRPDGEPCPGCIGQEAAAPLMFRALDLLPRSHRTPAGPRPAGVLEGPTAALPPGLRHFEPRRQRQGPSIAFPADGATLLMRDRASLPLRVEGGTRPFRWLVDGRPLGGPDWRREALWQPDGPGFAALQVIDADGRSATAEIALRPSP
jgi:penicillin-binding protein 1C